MRLLCSAEPLKALLQAIEHDVARVGAWEFDIEVEIRPNFDDIAKNEAHRDSPAMYANGSRPRKLLINEALFMTCAEPLKHAVLLHEIGHAVRDPKPEEPKQQLGQMPPPSEEMLADLFVVQCGHGATLAEDRRHHWIEKRWGAKNANEYAACLTEPCTDPDALRKRLQKLYWRLQTGQLE